MNDKEIKVRKYYDEGGNSKPEKDTALIRNLDGRLVKLLLEGSSQVELMDGSKYEKIQDSITETTERNHPYWDGAIRDITYRRVE